MNYHVIRKIFSIWLLFTITIWGCTLTKTSSSTILPSSAYFAVDPSELKSLHALARTQEARMKGCPKSTGCEDAYYTRGLVALFENRADAINMFHRVADHDAEWPLCGSEYPLALSLTDKFIALQSQRSSLRSVET